jgi:hypothetical protein
MEPKDLVRRAERLLNLAENIALRAEADNDNRLCLMSLDRAQRSLDSLLKVAGLLKPDNVTVIDQRSVNVYASWDTASLFALDVFHKILAAGGSISEAVEAVLEKQKAPALPRPQDDNEAA